MYIATVDYDLSKHTVFQYLLFTVFTYLLLYELLDKMKLSNSAFFSFAKFYSVKKKRVHSFGGSIVSCSNNHRDQTSISALHFSTKETEWSESESATAIHPSPSPHHRHNLPTEKHRYLSVYDKSFEWRDWLRPEEYENPWDASSSRLKPLDFQPADYATRHIIHLLQQFLLTDNSNNQITTEQCNAALTNLLNLMPPTNIVLSENDAPRTQRIAERANAILENMELLDHQLLQIDKKQNTLFVNRRFLRLPPKPNRETYNTVLMMFARTTGPRSVPQQAASIVRRMETRYTEYRQLEMKVTNFHWNCVLMAWAKCQDWEKPVHALQMIMENAARDPTLVDVSSYIHLLRLCSMHRQNRLPPNTYDKAVQSYALVAIKLWQELFDGNNQNDAKISLLPGGDNLPSHFYTHFLQALRPLGRNDMRRHYYVAAVGRAAQHGKINRYVLKEFLLHNNDRDAFNFVFGNYSEDILDLSADDAVEKLLGMVPSDWKLNADVGSPDDHHFENAMPPITDSEETITAATDLPIVKEE